MISAPSGALVTAPIIENLVRKENRAVADLVLRRIDQLGVFDEGRFHHRRFIATLTVVENAMAMMNGTQIGSVPKPRRA